MKEPTKFTEDQKYCIEALAEWVRGIHHLPEVHPFGCGVCVNIYGGLATTDFDQLTRLVLISHARAVRCEIASSGPGMVKVIAHRRQHGNRNELGCAQWHPKLEDLSQRALGLLEQVNVGVGGQ